MTGNTKEYYSPIIPKSRLLTSIELLSWLFKEREFNLMYYAFGLNRKDTKSSDFIGKKTFYKFKLKSERLLKQGKFNIYINHEILTKNKFYCSSILKSNNIDVIENIALIVNCNFIGLTPVFEKITQIQKLEDGIYLAKNVMLESGEGIFIFEIKNENITIDGTAIDSSSLNKIFRNNTWIIQRKLLSHSALCNFNSSALNTTRIYTAMCSKGPIYFGGYQAFARKGSNIDSWQFGSIYVGIDINSFKLKEFGITNLNDKLSGMVSSHPDSKMVFKDFSIPYLKDSIDLCLKAHKLFYYNFIIGWDVAIMDNGAFILEANENPGIKVLQCLNGGIKTRLTSIYEDLKYNYDNF